MSLGRELLLCCMVMVHVTFTGSQVTENLSMLRNITFDLPLCNLLMAEKAYVKYMFNDNLPKEFITNTSKPFWGITLPAENNSGEVLTFVSTIINCLDHAVPAIITNLTHWRHQPQILGNITRFREELKEVKWMYRNHNHHVVPARCPKQITACNDNCKKRNGFSILHYAKTWVKTFASCDDH